MEKLLLSFPISTLWLLIASFLDVLSTGAVLLGIVLSISTIIGVIYGVKWKVAYEVEVKTREAAVAFGAVKDLESKTLHGQLMEAKDLIADMKGTVERLSKLDDLATVVKLINESTARADQAAKSRLEYALQQLSEDWKDHEKAAETRTERIIAAIQNTGR